MSYTVTYFSNWQRPMVFRAHTLEEVKRLKHQGKEQQYLVEVEEDILEPDPCEPPKHTD
jgi:hypothetical protein